MQQIDGNTHNIVNDNLEALKQLFPEAFSEDKVDFEKLQILLGANITNDKEKYSFSWKGKNDAIKLALAQNTGTLRPDIESSKNFDTTQNLYIEGDNLEVLRTLQDSYRGQVKMIYIDPPYNTGKDFVYKDNFTDNVASYKEKMNENMKSNPETNGRYHTDWLNMMYPRLKLARNLLKDDGVIFISIDDNEVHNLRKIADEIFGEDNFVSEFIWEKKKKPSFLDLNVGKLTEYILCYTKNQDFTFPFSVDTTTAGKKYPINNAGNGLAKLVFPKGSIAFRIENGIVEEQNMSEGAIKTILLNKVEIENFTNKNEFTLEGEWRYSQSKINEIVKNGEIITISQIPFRPNHVKIGGEIKKMKNCFSPIHYEMETNEDATAQIIELFKSNLFDNPKPLKLLKYLIKGVSYMDENPIILDFFSGSGTTAHAVMQLNAEDGGNRKFIMVQIPEETATDSEAYKAGYKNICEIGKERIRRAGEKILEENKDKEGIENLDVGFKVFKLDTTNLKKWETSVEGESEDEINKELQLRLQDMTNPVKEDRKQIDMVYEIMLKNGMDLSLPMQELSIKGKKVFSIADNYLIACLEKNIDLETVKEIATLNPKVTVFYDDSFADDRVKINAIQNLEKSEIQVRVI